MEAECSIMIVLFYKLVTEGVREARTRQIGIGRMRIQAQKTSGLPARDFNKHKEDSKPR